MNILARRFSYGSAFVAFFVIAPLIVLYASGYRYNLTTGRIDKVGALYLFSVPEKSNISLNSKPTGKTTPTLLTAIHPGKNLITISREGFHPWQKTLDIKSGETTFVRDVSLFKLRPEAKIVSPGGRSFLIAPDKEWYSYIDPNGHIRLVNVATGDTRLAGEFLADELHQWANDKSLILFTLSNNWFTLNLNSLAVKPLAPYITANHRLVRFDPVVGGKYWALRSNSLYVLTDYNHGQRRVAENVDDYYLTSDRVITIERNTDGRYLRSYSLADMAPQWKHLLTAGQNMRLVSAGNNGMITMISQDETFIIDQNDGSDIANIPAAKFTQWQDQKLLIAGDFEIYYFDSKSRKTRLVDRTANLIAAVFWHPSGNYFLRVINNRVETVELDNRDILNINTLADVIGQTWALFNSIGDKLYILTADSNRQLTVQ